MRDIWRRRWWIAAAVALASAATIGIDAGRDPKYRSDGRVLVDATSDPRRGAGYLASVAEAAGGRGFAEQLVERGSLSLAPADLAERIDAFVVPGTRVIVLEVTAARPTDALRLAALAMEALREDLESEGLTSRIVDSPLLPDEPSSPRPLRDAGAAGGVALVVALAWAARGRTPQTPEPYVDYRVAADAFRIPVIEAAERVAEPEPQEQPAMEQWWTRFDEIGRRHLPTQSVD